MPLAPPVRFTPIAIAAVLLFAALIGLQCASQRLADRRSTVQDIYAQLAGALTDAGVLPLGSSGEMQAGLRLLGAGELTMLPGARAGTGSYSALNGLIHVYTNTNGVAWIELAPAAGRKLPRGVAADALQRIARLGYYTQAQSVRRAQGLRQAPSDFTFRVNGGSEQYEIAPLFDGETCTNLRITRAH